MFVKRFFCALVAFSVLFCVSCPVFASAMEVGGVPVGVQVQLDVVDFFNYCRDDLRWCYNSVKGLIDKETCPYAPTAGGAHKFEAVRTLVNGQVGLQYQCEYCHKNFGEAAEEKYREYVETLPGATYNSDGGYLWKPGLGDFTSPLVWVYFGNGASSYSNKAMNFNNSDFPSCEINGHTALAYPGQYVACSRPQSSLYRFVYVVWPSVRVPANGVYTLDAGILSSEGAVVGAAYSAGSTVSLGDSVTATLNPSPSGSVPWPAFWIVPYSGGDTYEIATRFSGTGNAGSFGYVEGGQLVQSSVGTIYDEETNIYQNPVTGDTSTVTSWQYDYSDRSYTLTTNDGDTVSVTYGDEVVTINEGGATYNVYYLMEEPEDVQEDASHIHSWVSEVTQPPTCTGTGVRTLTCTECGWQTTEVVPATGHSYSASVVAREPTCAASGLRVGTCTICGDEATEAIPATGHDYVSSVATEPTCVNTGVTVWTCSRCGDSYTRSIPAKGHTWEVISSVQTQYDASGQLIQEGFTLYQCSVCGEQYKISASSGGSSLPSASTDGVSTGEAGVDIDPDVGKGFLPTIAQGLNQDLPGVLETVSGWFGFFPDYYGGWAQFLKDGVSCLPAEAQVMISFGFGVILLLGILLRLAGRR